MVEVRKNTTLSEEQLLQNVCTANVQATCKGLCGARCSPPPRASPDAPLGAPGSLPGWMQAEVDRIQKQGETLKEQEFPTGVATGVATAAGGPAKGSGGKSLSPHLVRKAWSAWTSGAAIVKDNETLHGAIVNDVVESHQGPTAADVRPGQGKPTQGTYVGSLLRAGVGNGQGSGAATGLGGATGGVRATGGATGGATGWVGATGIDDGFIPQLGPVNGTVTEIMNISNALPPSVLAALSDLDAMEKDNDDTLAAMGKGNKTKGGGGNWRSTAPIPADDAAFAPDLNESTSNSSNATNGTTTRAGGASGGAARNGTDWRSIEKVNKLHDVHDYAWHDTHGLMKHRRYFEAPSLDR